MTRPLPSSTYRLQITPEFTLDDAVELCGYLARLGGGRVSLSPLLRAEAGFGRHGGLIRRLETMLTKPGHAPGFFLALSNALRVEARASRTTRDPARCFRLGASSPNLC